MPIEKAILVSIITESGLIPIIQDLLKRAGATGYTIEPVVSGFGTHGCRDGQFEGDQTSKIISLVSQTTADKIFEEIEETLEPHYALTAFRHQVEALMPIVTS
ncbi:MAG: hypothetical protein AB7P17_11425 [Nitrospirales bacterium]|nr:hypothetical protein [Nitrospirales bacterium]